MASWNATMLGCSSCFMIAISISTRSRAVLHTWDPRGEGRPPPQPGLDAAWRTMLSFSSINSRHFRSAALSNCFTAYARTTGVPNKASGVAGQDAGRFARALGTSPRNGRRTIYSTSPSSPTDLRQSITVPKEPLPISRMTSTSALGRSVAARAAVPLMAPLTEEKSTRELGQPEWGSVRDTKVGASHPRLHLECLPRPAPTPTWKMSDDAWSIWCD